MPNLKDYVTFTRPRAIPATAIFAVTGYAISPARPDAAWAIARDLALIVLIYCFLLWGGTNCFNSSQDQDEGPVNMLPNPPPIPPHLGVFGLVLKGLAIVVSVFISLELAVLIAVSAVLSIWYSAKVPWWRRAKEIGVVDNLINAAGCGIIAVMTGYMMTPAPVTTDVLLVGGAFTLAIFGGVPTAQIFQLRPGETYAEARNYTALLGPVWTLRIGAVFFALHLAVLAMVNRPETSVQLILWLAWAGLVIAGAIHSLVWSRSPFLTPYKRTIRQLTMLSGSQLCWVVAAWLQTM